MDLNSYLAVLAAEATALAAAADEAGLEAPVPTCPGWTVNDLVLHMGEVHRWATAVLTSRATKLSDVPGDSLGALPELAGTTDWLRHGAARLCEALATADPSVEYAAFLSDPVAPRVLFWHIATICIRLEVRLKLLPDSTLHQTHPLAAALLFSRPR